MRNWTAECQFPKLTRKHREWRFYVMQAEDARLQGKSLLRLLVETDRIHYDASFSADAPAQMSVDEKYRLALSYVQQAHNPPD